MESPDASSVMVYTCITGNRENLRDDQTPAGASFVAYVDRLWHSKVWQEKPALTHFTSTRRNARLHKILSHQFVDTEYSVWLDGNVALRMPPAQLVREWLDGCDLATFQHRTRGCTFVEGSVCAARNLDAPLLIEEQMARYRRAGLPADAGLPETCVIVRRHSRRVEQFNNAWFGELCRFSVRDQLSFMYAARATGLKVRLVTPTKYLHPGFAMSNRPAGIEPAPLPWSAPAVHPQNHHAIGP